MSTTRWWSPSASRRTAAIWSPPARTSPDLFDLFAVKGDCDASTVSGWVIDQLGRLPLVGDHFQAEGLDVTVTKVDHRRVLEVRVALAEEPEDAPEGAAR